MTKKLNFIVIFSLLLFQVVFNYIVKQDGGPEVEKELLTKYRPVLKPFVAEKPKLQLAAVYALQMSCYALAFPKGLLLRSFVNFYEMDIVDEHAFLLWKEDVDESYPGKGKALFQVTYLFTFFAICFHLSAVCLLYNLFTFSGQFMVNLA